MKIKVGNKPATTVYCRWQVSLKWHTNPMAAMDTSALSFDRCERVSSPVLAAGETPPPSAPAQLLQQLDADAAAWPAHAQPHGTRSYTLHLYINTNIAIP
jgi:hypothetical protein